MDPFLFDGFDCPQKLESLEQARVDDSWFLRKSSHEAEKESPHGEASKDICVEEVSPPEIKDKENQTISQDNDSFSGSNTSESTPPSEVAAPLGFSSGTASSAAGEVPPQLATESRCLQRSNWETLRQQRERRYEQLRLQRKESICRREQERVQLMRAAAVPKAHPIRHYKPLRIQRSVKPLTVAKSPDFALSRRDRHTNQQCQPE